MNSETMKLFDAEWNLMCFIWENQPTTASKAAAYALENFSWKKNTTYTVIKRLVDKKILRRDEPGFFIVPLVEKKDVQKYAAESLLQKRFDGNIEALRSSLKEAGYSL